VLVERSCIHVPLRPLLTAVAQDKPQPVALKWGECWLEVRLRKRIFSGNSQFRGILMLNSP